MTKKILQYSLSIMFLSIVFVLTPATADFSSVNRAQAGVWLEKAQDGGLDQVGEAYGGGTPKDLRMTVVDIIKFILGFLGIIAMVLIIYAGFKWMMSRGSEDEISDAKKILIAGVIGLVIILSAYLIANFVINQIYGTVSGTRVIWQ